MLLASRVLLCLCIFLPICRRVRYGDALRFLSRSSQLFGSLWLFVYVDLKSRLHGFNLWLFPFTDVILTHEQLEFVFSCTYS